MNLVYQALLDYVQDEKLLVEYLYVIYVLFSKYGNSIYQFLNEIKKVDEKLYEIMVFFYEEKFSRKDVYDLLMYAINTTWYNIIEIKLGKWVNIEDLSLPEWEIIENKDEDDAGLMVKTADWKIYKRFVLDDVKKMLNL